MLSITTCQLPEEWRIHLVSPIFKSGNRNDVRNYHLVSLLCLLSKVLERLVYNNIINFIKGTFSKHQFGEERSCLQQLLLYLDTIVEAHECSNSVDVIYLDLCKAFDSVSHLKLLHKLKFYGITGQLLHWFKSYLFNRWQCVRVNQSTSQLQCYSVSHKGVYLDRFYLSYTLMICVVVYQPQLHLALLMTPRSSLKYKLWGIKVNAEGYSGSCCLVYQMES